MSSRQAAEEDPRKCLHEEKTAVNPRSKAAHFLQPIFCIKPQNDGGKMQLTSFQSTSSCNMIHVNATNDCELRAQAKQ